MKKTKYVIFIGLFINILLLSLIKCGSYAYENNIYGNVTGLKLIFGSLLKNGDKYYGFNILGFLYLISLLITVIYISICNNKLITIILLLLSLIFAVLMPLTITHTTPMLKEYFKININYYLICFELFDVIVISLFCFYKSK